MESPPLPVPVGSPGQYRSQHKYKWQDTNPNLTCLGYKVGLHRVEEATVVHLGFAQFQEVEASLWSLLEVQVHREVA